MSLARELPWRTSPPRRRWWPLPGTRARERQDLRRYRDAVRDWCPCGRRARSVAVDLRAPNDPQGRCRAHERVPVVWPWVVDPQTAMPRPRLPQETWGQPPLACAVPLLVEELLGMVL